MTTQEWEELGFDDPYYRLKHTPCGTEVVILMGHESACPKCQPEEWAKLGHVVQR